jgi:hypothetical protein
MIEQVSVFLENSTGRLAQLTRTLGDAGIDMHALMVADTEEFGVVRIICDRPKDARDLLGDLGFGVSVTAVTAVEVPDRPGGLAEVLEALGAGGVNVEYAYCYVKPGADAAVDVFKVDGVNSDQILTDAGFKVLEASDLYQVGED